MRYVYGIEVPLGMKNPRYRNGFGYRFNKLPVKKRMDRLGKGNEKNVSF